MSAYWFKKSVRFSSGVSGGIFKKLRFNNFFSGGKFLVGQKFRFHPLINKGLVHNASIISFDLNVMDRKFFDETSIVSVNRKMFLSAKTSTMSL